MKNRKGASLAILVMVLLALTLSMATLFIFVTSDSPKEKIMDARFIENVYVEEEEVKFLMGKLIEETAGEMNSWDERRFRNKMAAKAKEIKPGKVYLGKVKDRLESKNYGVMYEKGYINISMEDFRILEDMVDKKINAFVVYKTNLSVNISTWEPLPKFKIEDDNILYEIDGKMKSTRLYIEDDKIKEKNCGKGDDFVVADINDENQIMVRNKLPDQQEEWQLLIGGEVLRRTDKEFNVVDDKSNKIGYVKPETSKRVKTTAEQEKLAGEIYLGGRRTCFRIETFGVVSEMTANGYEIVAGDAVKGQNKGTISSRKFFGEPDYNYVSHREILERLEGTKIGTKDGERAFLEELS